MINKFFDGRVREKKWRKQMINTEKFVKYKCNVNRIN